MPERKVCRVSHRIVLLSFHSKTQRVPEPWKAVTSFFSQLLNLWLQRHSWKYSREMPWQKELFYIFISPRGRHLISPASGFPCAEEGSRGFIWSQYDAEALLRDVDGAEVRSWHKSTSLPLLILPQVFSFRTCSVPSVLSNRKRVSSHPYMAYSNWEPRFYWAQAHCSVVLLFSIGPYAIK